MSNSDIYIYFWIDAIASMDENETPRELRLARENAHPLDAHGFDRRLNWHRRIGIGIGSLSDYTGRLKVFIGCFGRIIGGFGRFLIGGGAF